ncbi:hypothetical protein BGZ99_006227 [Dissophora globulifera]|uniref:N-acetyltransferase domain-containing protein n=1 Tax=Dissophora globulifera TaxID=979702 RepID=A0A9P6RD48_9FUNG|nr:hypothetical protein BGZ99_006227 [Dissophora globulifera]
MSLPSPPTSHTSSPGSDTKNTPTLIIRRADPENDVKHIDDFHRIINDAYRTEASWANEAHLINGERFSKDQLKDAMLDQVNILLLAFDPETGLPIGTVQLDPAEVYPDYGIYMREGAEPYVETTPKEQQIFVGLVSVDPRQQSRGIGRKLIDAGLRYAKEEMGRTQAVINVVYQRTELLDWYKRIGFVDYGERTPFPDLARIKHDDIHFAVIRMNM